MILEAIDITSLNSKAFIIKPTYAVAFGLPLSIARETVFDEASRPIYDSKIRQ